MNEQLIDQVIAPVTTEQVTNLTKLLSDLDIQMIGNIKSANQLNSVTGNSKSFKEYQDNATKTALATERIQQAQNKTAETTLKLNDVQARVAAQESARQAKAIVYQQKRDAAQAVSDAKQIAAAEAKAAKLQAIQDAAVRKANTQFPASQSSNNTVTTDDSPAVRYEPIITGQENMSISAVKSTEALTAETAAMLEQQEVLGSLSVAQRANIENLLALQVERAANASELKGLNVQDAVSGERAVFLTAEQLRLKVAIAEVSLELNRQTKEMIATDTSMKQLDASVLLLRNSYESLSIAERESENGQKMLAELNALDAENKKLALSVGNTSKQVGDYEKGQAKASTAMILGDKISNQFTRSIIRMGVQFLLIGVIFAGVTWLYELIKNLDIFTGRLDQAIQNLKALNEVMKSADSIAGDNIANLKILYAATQDVNLSEAQRLEAAETLKRLYPDMLKNSSDQTILNGEEADSIDKITAALIKEAQADAALAKIKEIEGKRLELAFERDKVNSAKAQELSRVKGNKSAGDPNQVGGYANMAEAISPDEQKRNIKYVADLANAKIKASDDILKNQEDFLIKFAGLGDIASIIEKAPGKIKAASDKTNTELLEYYRLLLEEVKKNAKLIVDDETQSYFMRNHALEVYLNASKQLAKNAEQIALADKNISAQKRKNIELQFQNNLLDVQRDAAAQRIKIQKEELSKIIEVSKESEQEQLETLDRGAKQALLALTQHKDERINAISLERAQNKISEKKYNEELLAINDQYNIDRINQEILVHDAIKAIKEGQRDVKLTSAKQSGATQPELDKIKSEGDKNVGSTEDRIAELELELLNAKSKQKIDQTKTPDKKDPKQAEIFALEQTIKAVDELDKLRQKAYENEISRLEKLAQQVDENATAEKDHVNNSILSSATKARQIAVIDAEANAQKKSIQEQENKIKQKEAIADKEAAIAKIILQTAIAAIKAPAELGPILGLAAVPVVLALGAFELATAASAKIPVFAKGTQNYPGGLGIWGEAGMERARLPDGSIRYSDGPEIANFPRGTIITPHMELMQLIKPDAVKDYAGGEQIGWGEVVKQLKKMDSKPARNRFVVNVNTDYEMYKMAYLRR